MSRNIFILGRSDEVRQRILGHAPSTPNLSGEEKASYDSFKAILGANVYQHSDEMLGDALALYHAGKLSEEEVKKDLCN